MKKKITLLKVFMTLCLLLVGIANAWGEDETVTFSFTNEDQLQGWTSNPASGSCETADNARGLAWSKAAITSFSYTLSDYGVSKVSIVASANDPGYTLFVNGGTGQAVTKNNNTTYDFDIEVAKGGTITISTTKGDNVKSFWIKSITLTKASSTPSDEPYLSVSPKTIDFGTVYQKDDVAPQQVTVTFANLTTNDVAAAISGSAFSINKTSSFTSGDKITITPNTATLGEYSETLKIFSETDNLEETVTVTMEVIPAPVLETYKKVTANKTDWSGEYLLVYENNSTAYVWTGVDAANCNATATISNNQISKPTDAVSLTIAAMDGGYSILVNGGTNDGKYISGTSGANKINFGATASANTITYPYADNNNSVKIVSNKATMRYNNASNNNRFRYFGSAGQQNVQLYEKVLPPTNEAVTFAAPEGGSLVIKNGETPIASGATIQNGTVLGVEFGMTPAEAYKDVAIKVTKTDGGDDVTSTVYNATKKQITMPRYAITVAVTSTKLYKISLVTAGEGTGSATMNGVTTDIYVDDETQIDLVASAVAPNEFTSWSATDNILINEVNKAETYALASGDGTITATFGISTLLPLDAPTLSEPTNITYSGVTLNWEALDNAEAYNVELLLNDETVASDVITGATSWTPEVTLQANTTYTYTVQGVGDGSTYAENNNPKAQSTVTTADYPVATLTLSENGITRDIVGKLNTPIDLPTTSTQTCEDKVFVGWSETTIDGETDTEPSLLGETYTFTDPEQLTATIYAVYAKETKGEVTWNIANDIAANDVIIIATNKNYTDHDMKTAGTIENSLMSCKASTFNSDKTQITLVADGTLEFTLGGNSTSGWTLQNGTNYLGMSSDKKVALSETSSTWTISFNNGVATVSQNYSSKDYGLQYNYNDGNDRFTGYTSNQVAISLYKKTQDITYSKFCTTFVTKVLESISLSGEYPTVFWKGEAFSHEGMTVTAHYSNADDADVTDKATFSGYDMSTAGEQTVTVTYETKSANYNIKVMTIANTPETAYTVAEARAIIDAGKDLDTEVYVKGTVSAITESFNATYGNISFDVSEDDQTTGDQFRFYRNFKGADKTKWTSAEECPAVGDFVIGYGSLTYYNTGKVYEFEEGNYIVNSVNMSITAAKWGTFCAPFDVTIPDGVKAYTADASGDEVAFTEVTTTIPAGTPVVVYSAEIVNKYYFGALSTEETCTEGALVGVYAAKTGITAATGYTNYVLQNNSGVVGFYKVSEGSISLKANRCYMTLPTTADVKPFFAFDDMADGICRILNGTDKSAEGIYDLNGCKLTAPRKGVNIINGVKVLVK